MALTGQIKFPLVFFILSSYFFSSSHYSLVLASSINGLTIKLVQRDSSESPLYAGNLKRRERINRLVHYSIARNHNFAAIPDTIRASMAVQGTMYMTQIGIGTFDTPPNPPYKSFFLIVDTGSDIIWTQCQGCLPNNCFRQKQPPFPSSLSRTYGSLPCDRHPFCFRGQCIGDACSYRVRYVDNSTTHGILATEKFTFGSNNNSTETINNMVFGCGIDNKNFRFAAEQREENQIAGILGLGWGIRSFTNQIKSQSQGRFSYCLMHLLDPHSSSMSLRFGADIPISPNMRVTPMFPESRSKPEGSYYLQLDAITIDMSGLGLLKNSSRITHGGKCIIDSGAAISHIDRITYGVLKVELMRVFRRLNMTRIGAKEGLDLCYEMPAGRHIGFPRFKFNLRNADLEVKADGSFIVFNDESGKQVVCLAMLGSKVPGVSTIGAFQQVDNRFIYDTSQSKLYFTPQDCSSSTSRA
ncbi:aspartic proteinase CDR1 [Ziziphus jujuba]|uniref:Aspartic proteinase CDR1 n=1 Tax=Ziziphus jujuba TaxID=326968 RepID=A0ABM3IWI3_ZIZJJ|nr:aspartic proteinase CDR1 [Ziziphus jujuba]XP_048336807.2 aspartic proteinase CDR1 [Ziziphus jujuba]